MFISLLNGIGIHPSQHLTISINITSYNQSYINKKKKKHFHLYTSQIKLSGQIISFFTCVLGVIDSGRFSLSLLTLNFTGNLPIATTIWWWLPITTTTTQTHHWVVSSRCISGSWRLHLELTHGWVRVPTWTWTHHGVGLGS